MSSLFPDTQPQAERVQIELLRRAPPWRKLDIVGQLNQTLRTLALSGLRQRHPQATPQELRRRLADLLLGLYDPRVPAEQEEIKVGEGRAWRLYRYRMQHVFSYPIPIVALPGQSHWGHPL